MTTGCYDLVLREITAAFLDGREVIRILPDPAVPTGAAVLSGGRKATLRVNHGDLAAVGEPVAMWGVPVSDASSRPPV